MIAVDPDVAAALGRQGGGTSLALRVTRQDGVEIGLTDHDTDLMFSGTLFLAQPGLSLRGGVEQTADLAPDNAEIITAIDPVAITLQDLQAERYADARAELWRLSSDGEPQGFLVSAGTLGEIDRDGDRLVIEFRGLAHQLSKVTGRLYQKSCDAMLGDHRCGVDLSNWLRVMAVTEHAGLNLVLSGPSLTEPEVYISGGAKVLTGALSGVNHPIRTLRVASGQVFLTLWRELPAPLAAGDQVELSPGCDKRFETCQQRFSNATRFRGFPFIPGTDVLAVVSSS